MSELEKESVIGGYPSRLGVHKSEEIDINNLIDVIKNEGIKKLSLANLIHLFDNTLITLNNSYNANMTLFRKSEHLYDIVKQEILERFNN